MGRSDLMVAVQWDRPICMECGHLLVAQPAAGMCPECGHAFTATSCHPPPLPSVGALLLPFAYRMPLILLEIPAMLFMQHEGWLNDPPASWTAACVLLLLIYGIPIVWLVLNLSAAARVGKTLCTLVPRAQRVRPTVPGVPFLSVQGLAQLAAAALALPLLLFILAVVSTLLVILLRSR